MICLMRANTLHYFVFIQRDLTKRRENKARAELAGKTDKVNQLRQEIAENEDQLNMAQVLKVLKVLI